MPALHLPPPGRRRTSLRAWSVLACAALLALPVLRAPAAAQDVRAVQAREARRADDRTLAYLARFKAAMVDRYGADPWLSMLEWNENEAKALVHAQRDAPAQLVIYQEGRWIGTDGRQLKPWAPTVPAATRIFPLSALSETQVRNLMTAHRAEKGHDADFLGPLEVGYYGAPLNRVVIEMQVISITGAGMYAKHADLATGTPLDLKKLPK